MVDQLKALKDRFNPKRRYEYENMQLDVDGIFVRIDEDGFVASEDGEAYIVPIEDVLQDVSIIRSARVSTGRDSAVINEKATGLIGALYRDEHNTPFEGGVMFRFRVRVPIYTAQPFFQLPYVHNEFSGRYSILDAPYATPFYVIQSSNTKIHKIFEEAEQDAQSVYQLFLSHGIAKEQARFAHLFRFFTKFYWTISLRHILELLSLEENLLSPKEFWLFRDNILRNVVQDWTPWAYDKYLEYPKSYKARWHEDIEPSDGINSDGPFKRISNIGTLSVVSTKIDENLIKLGIHTGPNPKRGFGHGVATFAMRVPIFVYRQWVRHRYGVWSEFPVDFDCTVSTRDFYVPEHFRKQIGTTMQYHFEDMNDAENTEMQDNLRRLIERSCIRYTHLRELGLNSRESATILPYVFRIPTLWTVNVESLMNFFSLRCDTHAQWEIRQYANTIYEWFRERYPWANKIFLEQLNFGKSDIFRK
ncbi:MAG: FAD-dependent thymidylate synthase [Patescibacteria group bacterium]